jgi:MOSC domain-containing protein YiiM
MARIDSIQIALPVDLGDPASPDPMDRPWRSAFFKRPVVGPVTLAADTIVGDGVADRVNHGGVDKAVLGYAAHHYAGWRHAHGVDAPPGGFGENLTLDGQTELTVCIGDVYAVGDRGVELEVSQPRQPCWKVGRRFRRADVPQRVIDTGFTGWYFRVRSTGQMAAGDVVRLVDRPYGDLTVATLNDMRYGRRPVTRAACDCEALAAGWRASFRRRLG